MPKPLLNKKKLWTIPKLSLHSNQVLTSLVFIRFEIDRPKYHLLEWNFVAQKDPTKLFLFFISKSWNEPEGYGWAESLFFGFLKEVLYNFYHNNFSEIFKFSKLLLSYTYVVSIKFSPLSTIDLTTNWYQTHNGDYG